MSKSQRNMGTQLTWHIKRPVKGVMVDAIPHLYPPGSKLFWTLIADCLHHKTEGTFVVECPDGGWFLIEVYED